MKHDINIYFVDDSMIPLQVRMGEEDGTPRWEIVVRESEPEVSHLLDHESITNNSIPITEAVASYAETLSDQRAERYELFIDNDGTVEKHDGYFNLEYPTMSRMARSFTDATARWWKAGRPTRSEEEVEKIFEEIF